MVDAVHLRDTIGRLPLAELALHLLPCLCSEHRGSPDPLPLGPGPLLARDAALSDVAPLPLGDGQGEVQQELVRGRGGIELPLGEDHQVDAGSVASLMKRRPFTALRLMRPMALTTRGVSDLHRGPSGPGGRSWRPIRSP